MGQLGWPWQVDTGHQTLDMVHPHLLQQGYGDQRTGECTLLKKKITQDDFALYSFSASSFIFAHSYQKGDNTIHVYRVSSFSVLIYTRLHRDKITFVSTYFLPSRSFLKRMNFIPTPNFVHRPLE